MRRGNENCTGCGCWGWHRSAADRRHPPPHCSAACPRGSKGGGRVHVVSPLVLLPLPWSPFPLPPSRLLGARVPCCASFLSFPFPSPCFCFVWLVLFSLSPPPNWLFQRGALSLVPPGLRGNVLSVAVPARPLGPPAGPHFWGGSVAGAVSVVGGPRAPCSSRQKWSS